MKDAGEGVRGCLHVLDGADARGHLCAARRAPAHVLTTELIRGANRLTLHLLVVSLLCLVLLEESARAVPALLV